MFISTATSRDEAERAVTVAVLPVGSFEQHGSHLPLSTDTLITSSIARRMAGDHGLLLPPVTIGCSHEHTGFAGSASVSSSTLHAIVRDVVDMHGGESETSVLLAESPEVVRPNYRGADNIVDDRRFLLTVGMAGYTDSGIIGRPSLATAEKGRMLLDALSERFKEHLGLLLPQH